MAAEFIYIHELWKVYRTENPNGFLFYFYFTPPKERGKRGTDFLCVCVCVKGATWKRVVNTLSVTSPPPPAQYRVHLR